MLRFFLSFLILAGALCAQTADWIITARYVVTMAPNQPVIEEGAVVISGARIAAVGPRAAVEKQWRAKQRLNFPDGAITPGLINTHTHAAMSLFRGLADDLNLQDWLTKHMFPAEARNVDAEFVRWGTRLACLEMLLSGATTYADMYYFEEVAAEATKEAGMRGVLGQTIIQFPAPDAPTPEAAFERADRFLQRFRDDPLITPAVAPHAIYTNTREMLETARKLADRYEAPLLIHLSETRKENEDTQAQWQGTPTQLLAQWGILKGRTLAAHGIWLDDQDISILREHHTGVAHCPSSNMKLASGVAPVPRMLEAGLAVGLGTDGPAGSNNDFQMFEEVDLAAKLQKVISGDPQILPAIQALHMATLGGARALGMDRDLGSLEPGKLADLIAVRMDAPHAVPVYDPISHLVYALKGSDVAHVMVNGRWVVRDRKVLTLNQREILSRAAAYAVKIRNSLRDSAPQ